MKKNQMNQTWNLRLRELTLALVAFLFFAPSWAQYDVSNSFYTEYFNEALQPEDRSILRTACDVISYFPRKKNYAIVGMNYADAPHCGRYVNFYEGPDNLKASSGALFSEIHSGISKVLFRPNDPNTFYVLYQEHRVEDIGASPPDSDFRTYLRRFHHDGTAILVQSSRLEIFPHNNGVDMAIAKNGDVMIAGVDDEGSVKMRVVRDMSFLTSAFGTTMPISEDHEARRQYVAGEPDISWKVSMDCKGDQVAIAHTKGTGSPYSLTGKSIRLVRFNYEPLGASFYGLADAKDDEIGSQMLVEDPYTPRSVGMRANGDVVYLWKGNGGFPEISLAKIKATGPAIPSYIFTEAPSAKDVVVSVNDDIFVSGIVDGEYAIGLFNGLDQFEHLYDIHTDLDNPTHDIAVDECNVLATGHKYVDGSLGSPHHQLFSCEECNGGGPHAEFDFVAPVSTPNTGTYYGLKPMALYCSIDDMVVDGSASACEKSYWIAIHRMNVNTWTILETLYSNWVGLESEVPNNIQIADLLSPGTTFDPAAKYLMTLTVGLSGGIGTLHSEHKLFKIYPDLCGKAGNGEASNAEIGQTFGATVFPNPSQGQVNIEVSNGEQLTQYKVTDMLGKQVLQGEFLANGEIDLNPNPAGIYFLHLSNGQSELTKKIVLKK